MRKILDSTSHGERKRAQIATALWQAPDLLAVDEPTNHLDLDARKLVADALTRFAGVGLLVSHDRMLLDSLCGQCLFAEPPHVEVRPGGFTEAAEAAKREQNSLRRQKEIRKKEYQRLDREFKRRKEAAGHAKKRVSKGGLARHDHDAREKRDRARVSGKDAADSRRRRQFMGRLNQAGREVKDLRVRKEATLGIWFEGNAANRDRLLDLPAGRLMLGDEKCLVHPELVIRPADCIALIGPNGSGKSTLVREIVSSLQAPRESILYMPQEMDIAASVSLLDEVRRLSSARLGELMAIVSHLGSQPDRLLTTQLPSPGEVRKLFLALGILNRPQIILMDEPTNHMDLPSTQCLEKALAQCPCGFLLVSHDMTFLRNLTKRTWEIQTDHDTQGKPNTFFLHEK